jgi:hypothetical protein
MKSFFAGLFLGLAALAFAGSHVVSANWAANFIRFGVAIHPESNYFPTVRQMMQIVDAGDANKITVIVGGTSVLYGVGQQDALVWTHKLQAILGDRFRVINFAQRAGRANDFGNIAAEVLLKRKQPVIYVADGMPLQFSIDYDNSFYQHEIVEAKTRGYLLPWPPRDKLLELRATEKPNQLQSTILGSILDRELNFVDLWNYVTFEYVNINWTSRLPFHPWQRRSEIHIDDLSPADFQTRRYKGVDENAEITVSRSWIAQDSDPRWPSVIGLTVSTMPPDLRKDTVAIVNLRSPYYLKQMSEQEQKDFVSTAEYHRNELARIGFSRTLISGIGYDDNDYVDGLHLSVSGGSKLADIVAPEVISLAHERGYQ